MNSGPLVSARNISKSYQMGRRSLTVLRKLDIDVYHGDFIALRGASGAGKSTLLHMLGGLDTPDEGEILFAGQRLAAFSASATARLRNSRIGFVFQAYHLLPELSALENVCLPARIGRIGAVPATSYGCE